MMLELPQNHTALPVNINKTTTVHLSIYKFPAFYLAHSKRETMTPALQIERYYRNLFKLWITPERIKWILPSVTVMANFFLSHPDDVLEALTQLDDQGFKVLVYDIDGFVTVEQIAKKPHPLKSWLSLLNKLFTTDHLVQKSA